MTIQTPPPITGLSVPDIEEYLTVIEFAQEANITRHAVNKMIKEERLRAILKGKTYLIHKSELSKYLSRK